MGAFDDAAAALHADPNLSRLALWRAGGTGDRTPIRVIYSEPAREESFGQTGKVARDIQADILLAAAPTIARGDTLQIAPPDADSVQPGDPLFTVAVLALDEMEITARAKLQAI